LLQLRVAVAWCILLVPSVFSSTTLLHILVLLLLPLLLLLLVEILWRYGDSRSIVFPLGLFFLLHH
jgi:hypothetical protein